MKVFEISMGIDVDTVCANSILEALQVHHKETGLHVLDYDAIEEIPKKKWSKIIFTNDEGESYSLAQYMKKETPMSEFIGSSAC